MPDRIIADLRDGVLTVTCPKATSRRAAHPHVLSHDHADGSFVSRAAPGLRLRRRARDHRPHARQTSDAVAQTGRAPPRWPSPPPGVACAAATLPDFTRVAERTVPAVVNISSQQVVRRPNSPFANDPFFQFFFGDRDDVFGPRRGVERSLGSGVIVSADGLVLTNNHVVAGESGRISLQAAAGRSPWRSATSARSQATIVGVDPATDLALLKIDAGSLPTIPWGDSSTLKVAEWVLAIGNPFQLNQTVTLGIVSALGRDQRRHLRLRGLHPDRRRDQPRQLRRRAGQRARRARRHQHRDLQPERRLPGDRLRRAEQPGAAGRRRPDPVRRGPARLDRLRGDRAAVDAMRRSSSACPTREACSSRRCAATPRPTKRACGRAT